MLWADAGSCWLNFSKTTIALPPCSPAGTASLSHCALPLSHRSLASAPHHLLGAAWAYGFQSLPHLTPGMLFSFDRRPPSPALSQPGVLSLVAPGSPLKAATSMLAAMSL